MALIPWYTYGLLALLGVFSCSIGDRVPESPATDDPTPYRFWVAGHAYGHPDESIDSLGLFPPFYRELPGLAADSTVEFGVLTGDVVKWNMPERHDSVVQQLTRFAQRTYLVPGNHDTDGGQNYDNWHAYYGLSWYSQRIHNDLYLFLDPNLDHWRINDAQMAMLQVELAELADVHNIFVFMHQVLWWSPEPDSAFHAFEANSPFGRADSLNFWDEVVPMFNGLEQEVYFFAGDVGAWCRTRSLGYYQSGNIHFLTSGMGCHHKSNYLLVSVNADREVSIDVKWIGRQVHDPAALGTLEDWRIVP
ncbi:MAG: metallophosphoesterase [Bacteroidota bacterium]